MLRLVLSAFFLLGFLFGRSCAQHPVTDFNKFLPPGEHAGALRFDDHDRQFIIFTPPGATADNPRPIVFFFHGAGGSAEQAAATYGWVEKAKAEHLFVVFPQGLPVRPNGNRASCSIPTSGATSVRAFRIWSMTFTFFPRCSTSSRRCCPSTSDRCSSPAFPTARG
jgi:poly(3-hydroxybutyrate) depolymerase